MKSLGQDGASLPVTLEPDGRVSVEGETIGRLDGFRFTVDPQAGLGERKMLLSAGEKALPGILSQRAEQLLAAGLDDLEIKAGTIQWQDMVIAEIAIPDDFGPPRLTFPREISAVPDQAREKLEAGLLTWLQDKLAPLEPLRKLSEAATDPNAGSQARALLVTLIDARGVVAREKAGLEHLPKEMRPFLRKLGVTFGALDIFARDLLKPAPRQLLHALGLDQRPLQEAMLPVLSDTRQVPAGYRMAGNQVIRVDLAEKILRAAFDTRAKASEAPAAAATPEPAKDEVPTSEPPETGNDNEAAAPEAGNDAASEATGTPKPVKPQPTKKGATPRNGRFALDLALPVSIGLEEENARRLLGSAGFRVQRPKPLAEGAHGPLQPDSWIWRPKRAGDRNNRRDDRRDNRKGAQSKGKRPGKGNKPQHGKGAKGGKPKGQNAKRGGNNRNQRQNKPDFGPARAGGAFDKLADLLKP